MSATVVQKLQDAGAIIIGKTQSVEFALGGWGTNQYLGAPWNPWDLETHRVPGGSSSGSGVAVAAGLISAALGTDTGGSVRLPSAFCGLVGLKPTFGRISNHGVMPLSHTLDTVGPLARSVADAALIYDVLQGPDPNHTDTLYQPPDNSPLELKEDLAGFCLAALPDEERRVCSDDVNHAYDRTLKHAEDLGATIIIQGLPHSFETYRNLSNVVISAEGYAHAAELVDQTDLPIGDATLQRILPGKTCSARDYLNAMMQFQHWRAEFKAQMAGIDALLTPTTTGPAIPVVDVDEQLLPAHYTRATNVLGLCALAIPNGLSKEGLPLSLCVHGHPYTESTILRIGWSLEQQFKALVPSPPGLG
jgi:aspartyl-tRNA(Asn)/glutamyl-tRNA(Gln) amidotransferase subunit A